MSTSNAIRELLVGDGVPPEIADVVARRILEQRGVDDVSALVLRHAGITPEHVDAIFSLAEGFQLTLQELDASEARVHRAIDERFDRADAARPEGVSQGSDAGTAPAPSRAS